MKNSIVPMVMVAIILVSQVMCKTQKNIDEVPKLPITEFREAMAGLYIQDQLAIFNTLPSEIQYALWKDRISNLIESETSSAIKTFLEKSLSMLQPGMYVDSTSETLRMVFLEKQWVDMRNEAFGTDTAKMVSYLTKLGNENATTPMIEEQPKISCNCSLLSDYCIIWKCKTANCKVSNWGCGSWWTYPCDGMCKP